MSGIAAGPPEEPLITRCAWCARYEIGDGEWVDEETIRAFARPGAWESALASHGICPDCVADLKQRGLSR
ncbi:MAG: hypothetical protein KY396_04595 [Actinobacteria bacterium]|nr:hypothetical protein [Actinomycetota bacterium]